MKMTHLASTTQRPSTEGVERARQSATSQVRRVESAEGMSGDRERSLQQEMAEVPAELTAEFAGGELIQEEAHALAERLTQEGVPSSLLKTDVLVRHLPNVNDEA